MYFRRSSFVLAILLALTMGSANAAIGERRDRNAREFTGGTGWGDSKEEILQNRKRRKRQLKNMVNAMRKKLADHSAGEITLEPQEKADTERRLDLFSRKLDMMKVDLEEHVRATLDILPTTIYIYFSQTIFI